MLQTIVTNIKDFFDMTIFFTMLFIGLFALLSDFRYFKKVRYTKDAAITLVIAVIFLILPFALWIVSMF